MGSETGLNMQQSLTNPVALHTYTHARAHAHTHTHTHTSCMDP